MRDRVILSWIIVVVCAFLSLWLATHFKQPLFLFGWVFGMAFLQWYITGCANCGKSPFIRERRRIMGWSIGSSAPWPERICSRCGHSHFEEEPGTA